MAKDPELQAHLEWIGYVQPVGLVVSAPALIGGQAQINRDWSAILCTGLRRCYENA